MSVFEPFLEGISEPEHRNKTEEVLSWVAEHFPGLGKRIAWGMPMFTDHGTFIISFSVARAHLAVGPEAEVIRHFEEDIKKSGYTNSRMLIRIPWMSKVDYQLLRRIISYTIEDKKDCKTFWIKPGA